MEHTVFLLYAAVALSLLNLTVAQQDVFISEVMFDPRSNDDLVEYIELYNAGTTAVTLDDWTIPGMFFTRLGFEGVSLFVLVFVPLTFGVNFKPNP